MPKPVVGAQLYTLRDYCKTIEDTVATLAKVKAIGYTAVQLSGVAPMKDQPKELGKAVKDSGLDACCTHIGFERLCKEPEAVIAEHRLWGAKHVAIGGLPADYFQPGGVARFVEELKAVGPKLAAAGMDFSYHNHSHEFQRIEGGKTWLAQLYETAPGSLLKAELDTYWVTAGGGSPATWIRTLGKRQPLLHLKDMCVANGREQRFAAIGNGNLDWPSIFAAAQDVGVEYMLVEQDNCYGVDPFEELAASYRFIASMGYR
jgi:sugar phosphate isomerase/epimerase